MFVCASIYALFTASVFEIGVITLIILLFAISSDFLIVVVPLTSSAVVGDAVFMPISPVLLPNNPPNVAPGIPDGGIASVHVIRVLDQMIIRIILWYFIFIASSTKQARECMYIGLI